MNIAEGDKGFVEVMLFGMASLKHVLFLVTNGNRYPSDHACHSAVSFDPCTHRDVLLSTEYSTQNSGQLKILPSNKFNQLWQTY